MRCGMLRIVKPVRAQVGVVELVPVDRRRDRAPGGRAGTVRRDEGLVDGVLRVVQPRQAAALVDLPLPADQIGHDLRRRSWTAARPRSGWRRSRARRDRHPDLDAAPAGHLRPARTPRWSNAVRCSRASTSRSSHLVSSPGSRSISAYVGRCGVVDPRRPGVPLQRAEVRRPHQRGGLVDDQIRAGLPRIRLRVVPAGEPVRGVRRAPPCARNPSPARRSGSGAGSARGGSR